MKISKLIEVLESAKEEHGDIPVMAWDAKWDCWVELNRVLKLHPYDNGVDLFASEIQDDKRQVKAIGVSFFN